MPLADLCRKHLPQAFPPEEHRPMRDIDAACVEQIFDVPKRERELDINHHRKAEDRRGSREIFERITHCGRLENRAGALNPF
jgi:hypothetical protein